MGKRLGQSSEWALEGHDDWADAQDHPSPDLRSRPPQERPRCLIVALS